MNLLMKLGLIGSLSMLLWGCMPQRGFLEPSQMPREQIASAILRTPTAALREGEFRDESDFIRIVSIDGNKTQTLDNRVVLSPGVHDVQVAVEIRRPNPDNKNLVNVTRSDTSLRFEAKPDAEYLLDAKLTGVGLWVWVVDEFEQQVVAGRHPSGKTDLSNDESDLGNYADEDEFLRP